MIPPNINLLTKNELEQHFPDLFLALYLGAFTGFMLKRLLHDEPLSIALDPWVKLSTIIGVVAVFIGASAYRYQQRRDNAAFLIEQIRIFRKEILNDYNKYRTAVLDAYQIHDDNDTGLFVILHQPLGVLTEEEWVRNFPREAQAQNLLYIDRGTAKKQECFEKQNGLLNLLEEFAAMVISTELQGNEALNSVKATFIKIIEDNWSAIFFYKRTQGINYPAVRKLYPAWSGSVDRTTPQ